MIFTRRDVCRLTSHCCSAANNLVAYAIGGREKEEGKERGEEGGRQKRTRRNSTGSAPLILSSLENGETQIVVIVRPRKWVVND